MYFQQLAVKTKRQKKEGHIRISGAVLKCLWNLHTAHSTDWAPVIVVLWWWGLQNSMLTGAWCCWVSLTVRSVPHYKNSTLSSNKGQKLAACSNDIVKRGRRTAMGAEGSALEVGYPIPWWFGLTEGDSSCGGHPAAMSGVMTALRMDGRFAGG